MESKSLAYFSTINPLARKIIKDEKYIKSALKEQWNEFSWQEQEALIDDFIVDNSVRERYSDVVKQHAYPKSFPKLKVETGDKIVVDFENDCWTWQDEHSAPFNWRSKSQQDLTLDDLEPENLCSKPKKEKKADKNNDTSAESNNTPGENREFSVVANSIWESPFLQGMEKPDYLNRSRSVSPTKSYATSRESLVTSRSKTPEEVNYAFSASMEDLSSSPSTGIPDEMARSMSVCSGEILNDTTTHTVGPTKPPRQHRSISKSPIKSILSTKSDSEEGSLSLVSNNEDDVHAFDNPVIGNEWGTFVNDKEEETSSATPSPYKTLLKEPEPIDMDRGREPAVPQTGLLSDDNDEYQDEFLYVEKTHVDDADNLNESSMSRTGFDFLDNW